MAWNDDYRVRFVQQHGKTILLNRRMETAHDNQTSCTGQTRKVVGLDDHIARAPARTDEPQLAITEEGSITKSERNAGCGLKSLRPRCLQHHHPPLYQSGI